jgi:hypothetical protein
MPPQSHAMLLQRIEPHRPERGECPEAEQCDHLVQRQGRAAAGTNRPKSERGVSLLRIWPPRVL